MSLPPSEIPQGAIRFNTDSQKLEFYAQGEWWNMVTDNVGIATSGDTTAGARGVYPLGNGASTRLDFINLSSTGDAQDFGDLSDTTYEGGGCASSTRGLHALGYTDPTTVSTIEKLTIASTGSVSSFGNLSAANRITGSLASATRGVWGGGAAPFVNLIQYVTIASDGTAVDFGGNMTFTGSYTTGFASPTRGVFAGGHPGDTNVISFITIATTGEDAQDFGDLTVNREMSAGSSNSTRGIVMGGAPSTSSPNRSSIDYVTIATLGNAVNFGDLTQGKRLGSGFASSTRAFMATGYTPAAVNDIDYVEIATQGNAVDFGDAGGNGSNGNAMSNAHGGL